MQVGLTNSGSEAHSLNSRPSLTLKVFSALSGVSWARPSRAQRVSKRKAGATRRDFGTERLPGIAGRDSRRAGGGFGMNAERAGRVRIAPHPESDARLDVVDFTGAARPEEGGAARRGRAGGQTRRP